MNIHERERGGGGARGLTHSMGCTSRESAFHNIRFIEEEKMLHVAGFLRG